MAIILPTICDSISFTVLLPANLTFLVGDFWLLFKFYVEHFPMLFSPISLCGHILFSGI